MIEKEFPLSPTSNSIVQDQESLVLQQAATTNIHLDKKLEGRVGKVLLYLVARNANHEMWICQICQAGCGALRSIEIQHITSKYVHHTTGYLAGVSPSWIKTSVRSSFWLLFNQTFALHLPFP